MTTSGGRRTIEVARAAWGAGMLVAPKLVLARVHRVEVDERAVVISRILGARHVTQALLSGLTPSPEVLAMGVWVDAVHAGTAVGLAAVDPARKRAGLSDAAVAAIWAVIGYRDIRRVRVMPRRHDLIRDRLARAVLGVAPGGSVLRGAAAQARRRSAP